METVYLTSMNGILGFKHGGTFYVFKLQYVLKSVNPHLTIIQGKREPESSGSLAEGIYLIMSF